MMPRNDMLLLWIVCFFSMINAAVCVPVKEFVESFVKHYELTPEGRYVHEYHPFVLKKTAESFHELESMIKANGFNVVGRNVIIGYEEAAVPSYYTNYKEARIDDEASIKSRAGWSLKLHNRFGFMTGFLFKDVNNLKDCVHGEVFFEHINPDRIALFDTRAAIFQEHAFGEALPLIIEAKELVVDAIVKNQHSDVFKTLITFWNSLYTGGFKIGNNQIAGTQDILFSMQYADYLASSTTPLQKYFIGPDITYPIEIFEKQEKEVTYNAQTFVKKFVPVLEAVNNEPTAYVFCSFVDGVGKSTMLGNIKNRLKFGESINLFEHVDNSSSQLAEMFLVKDKVFIADLPAQISHFTYKPDGYVFVDARTECTKEWYAQLVGYAKEQRAALEARYEELLTRASRLVASKGWWASALTSPDHADLLFIKNVLLLKKTESNTWRPFEYEGLHYLVNADDMTAIRTLVPLACVKSEGLKNIESEQMLFTEGIRFPLPYQHFLDDLTKKMQQVGIKNVVFVDFLSMYPRSSRENVRVNYLLQQMAFLDPQFDVAASLYRTFISGGELLYSMTEPRVAQQLFQSFKLETLVRMILYRMILDRSQGDLTGLDMRRLTTCIKEEIKALSAEDLTYLHQRSLKKYQEERHNLENTYGMSKSFVNVQQFFTARLFAFDKIMRTLFTRSIDSELMQYLWEDNEAILRVINSDFFEALPEGFADKKMAISDEECIRCGYKIYAESKNESIITPLVRQMRFMWYTALTNLLRMEGSCLEELDFVQEPLPLIPLRLYKANSGDVYLFQQQLEEWKSSDGKLPSIAGLLNGLTDGQYGLRRHYVNFMERPFVADWEGVATQFGLFGFTSMLGKGQLRSNSIGITYHVRDYQRVEGAASVMPTAVLGPRIKKNNWLRMSMERNACKNGYRRDAEANDQKKIQQPSFLLRSKIYLGGPEQRFAAQLFVRMLATLEMVVKDPDADVVIRFGNKEDFAAGLFLIEQLIVPRYGNVLFLDNLFDDYSAVEPYPSWDYWETVTAKN